MSFEEMNRPAETFGSLLGMHRYSPTDFQPGDNFEIDEARALEARYQMAAARLVNAGAVRFRDLVHAQEFGENPSHAA